MKEDVKILPPVPPQAGLETRRSQRSAPRRKDSIVSGTVEILFPTHTDASRGVASILYPVGMQVTGYGRLPISGQSLDKAFLSVLCASSEAGGE